MTNYLSQKQIDIVIRSYLLEHPHLCLHEHKEYQGITPLYNKLYEKYNCNICNRDVFVLYKEGEENDTVRT